MSRKKLLSPMLIEQLDFFKSQHSCWNRPDPDPDLVAAVEAALQKLPADIREVIVLYHLAGLSLADIVRQFENRLSADQVKKLITAGRSQLKTHLAAFVAARWNITPPKTCRICVHPQRARIDKMLAAKPPAQSWGIFIGQLQKIIGEKIYPPQILISHRKHFATEVSCR